MKSAELFKKAKKVLPGGVNSPVRAFKSVGSTPPFIQKGKGSKIYSTDGKEYIDYVLSWGPLILGHADKDTVKAVKESASLGLSFGAPTAGETELAEIIIKHYPSMSMLRLVNSGTEAVMSAIRLARGYTKRDKIIKFQGCYHGHSDDLLVAAGSGAATFGNPDSLGVPKDAVKNTLNLPYNNISAVKKTISKYGKSIACVIIEPVAGNMGVVLPRDGYLEELRKVTKEAGILLIFDEVMTGFRAEIGGVQSIKKIKPDITTLGKVIGGGMPIGAYGGRRDIMKHVSPDGAVYQAGTLSGNPVSVAAGIATLKKITQPNFFKKVEDKCTLLASGLNDIFKKNGLKYSVSNIGTMFGFFFNNKAVLNYDDAKKSDLKKFSLFHRRMLNSGIYLAPSQFEAGFISSAHSANDIEKTLEAYSKVLKKF